MLKPQVFPTILYAEDEHYEIKLCQAALEDANVSFKMEFVQDGLELMDYLYHRGKYSDKLVFRRPQLIMLDLSMPGKNGKECLAEIKSEPELQSIPVVIFSTCSESEIIREMYTQGAASYITKPLHFLDLIRIFEMLDNYWIKTTVLPGLDQLN